MLNCPEFTKYARNASDLVETGWNEAEKVSQAAKGYSFIAFHSYVPTR